MYAITPINTPRFGFSERQYSLGSAPEEVGPLRSLLRKVLPYTLQETRPAEQTLFYGDRNEPIHFIYAGNPGQYKLYLQA